MKVTVAAIGKFKNSPEKDIYTSYIKRIPWQFSLKEFEAKKALSGEQLKSAEAGLLLSAISKDSKVIVLDEHGKNLGSTEFAALISSWQDSGTSNITFIIGGAEGLTDSVHQRADFILSFGRLTWPHMLVRSMLAEQIYRAYSIIKRHPYHRG